MVYWIVWSLLKMVRPFCFPLKIYGKENIPQKGAFILASNHRSYLDPPLVSICHTWRISFVARDSLFKGFAGWLFPKLEAFPIKRQSADVGAIKEALNRLERGLPVLLFPEGTRTTDPIKRRIQPGIGMIAVKSGLPVVPVFIKGSDDVLPAGAKSLKRRPVTVTFGAPMFFKETADYPSISREVMEKILSMG
ncbi:MAG: 1-acyl-sn-glycerol-3-phosphate acyltransferase [Candidatus Omnitrophica bacterium]|nr:1-acyl-sn-glycerol-3-phosphate acyltransferase [Candidatus Omnitrophota bacterium]